MSAEIIFKIQNQKMGSSSILCEEFSCLLIEKQNEEIGKLYVLLGGIGMKRYRDESDEDFRIRTFTKALEKLPDNSEYEREFFENRIIPSLIDDFKESSMDTQEMLMKKLSELTDGLLIKRKYKESKHDFNIRFYSRLLPTLSPDLKYKMVEFAWRIDGSSDSDGDSDEYNSDDESNSARVNRGALIRYDEIAEIPEGEGGLSYPMETLKIAEGEAGFNPAFIKTLRGRPPPSPPPSSSNPPPRPKRKNKK